MKRCPECRRDYYDDTLSFCLDDGRPLVDGPRIDEAATAILTDSSLPDDAATRRMIETDAVTESLSSRPSANERNVRWFFQKKHWQIAGFIAVLGLTGFFSTYRYFSIKDEQSESVRVDPVKTTPGLYWQMTKPEQLAFIGERSRHIQTLIDDERPKLTVKRRMRSKPSLIVLLIEGTVYRKSPFRKVCALSTAALRNMPR